MTMIKVAPVTENKRILVCGDLHCKPEILKKALAAAKWDIFVFLGDACDNFGATQNDNLEILELLAATKQKYGDKFIWLLGNHDWCYYDSTITPTGHIRAGEAKIHKLLVEHRALWDLFYVRGSFLFSHAGISRKLLATDTTPYIELKTRTGYTNPMNNVGPACGGWSSMPGPLWARPEELGPLPTGYLQIVGHTPVETIQYMEPNLLVCDTFSQYVDGSHIGDCTLLLIENEKKRRMYAIDYATGTKQYEL